jgi:hypothetical protein
MAQTAVEWFYQRILAKDIQEVFEQAKEMEKEQIIDAFDSGLNYDYDDSETYYNKTYTNGL